MIKGIFENPINIYNLPHEPVRNAAGERRVSDSDTLKNVISKKTEK